MFCDFSLQRLFCLLNFLIIIQNINAQYNFNISISYNTNCRGVRECEEAIRICNSMANDYISKCKINFNSRSECEAARGMTISGMNDVKSIADQAGVKFNFTVSPCSGSGGNFVFLGPNRGTSFYSPNFAEEIKNWSEDHIEQQLALNPESKQSESIAVETNDHSFDEERTILRKDFVINTDRPFRSINIDEDGRINTQSTDFISHKIIPADEQLVTSYLDSIRNLPSEDIPPIINDEQYIYWIQEQYKKLTGYDIEHILHSISRNQEENIALRNFREFEKRLINDAIAKIDLTLQNLNKRKEKLEVDLAVLALDCYEQGSSNKYLSCTNYDRVDLYNSHLPNGIQNLANIIADYNATNDKTGFNAVLYHNRITNEYVVAFEGSTFNFSKDAWNDFGKTNALNAAGMQSEQFKMAKNIGDFINNESELNDVAIYFTGHSLGGGLASLAGLVTGRPTSTYNAEGIRNNVLKDFGLLEKKINKEYQITAYYSATDILTRTQNVEPVISPITGFTNNIDPIGDKINIGINGLHQMEPIVEHFIQKNDNVQGIWQKYTNAKNNMKYEMQHTEMASLEQIYITTE